MWYVVSMMRFWFIFSLKSRPTYNLFLAPSLPACAANGVAGAVTMDLLERRAAGEDTRSEMEWQPGAEWRNGEVAPRHWHSGDKQWTATYMDQAYPSNAGSGQARPRPGRLMLQTAVHGQQTKRRTRHLAVRLYPTVTGTVRCPHAAQLGFGPISARRRFT